MGEAALTLARIAIVALLAISSATASAMNWCNLERMIPTYNRSFETIAQEGAALTGCASQVSDSAHEARWRCPGAPIGTEVSIARDPDHGAVLVVIYEPSDSLAMLRRCRPQPDQARAFDPGSFVRRDSLSLGYEKRVLLLNAGPSDPSVLIAGSDTAVEQAAGIFEQQSFGITRRPYPTSSARVAGIDIVRSSLPELLAGLRSRGSNLLSNEGESTLFSEYRLSPPVGLAGVASIKVGGLLDHVLSVTYEVPAVADYETYIGLLNEEYGQSQRHADRDGCISRWWGSGDVAIRGRHCQTSGNSILFMNRVASQQWAAFDEHDRARQNSPRSDTRRPTIDPDNY